MNLFAPEPDISGQCPRIVLILEYPIESVVNDSFFLSVSDPVSMRTQSQFDHKIALIETSRSSEILEAAAFEVI
jgi:hypothetical protein